MLEPAMATVVGGTRGADAATETAVANGHSFNSVKPQEVVAWCGASVILNFQHGVGKAF